MHELELAQRRDLAITVSIAWAIWAFVSVRALIRGDEQRILGRNA